MGLPSNGQAKCRWYLQAAGTAAGAGRRMPQSLSDSVPIGLPCWLTRSMAWLRQPVVCLWQWPGLIMMACPGPSNAFYCAVLHGVLALHIANLTALQPSVLAVVYPEGSPKVPSAYCTVMCFTQDGKMTLSVWHAVTWKIVLLTDTLRPRDG
jgi:hypothetical protein